nr:hypothetical protein [Tanacetum cinerariifolium]GEZ60903.1 hypothetical protein [Tanacetum cinerariifolium]
MSIMPCGSKYKTAQELWAAILKTFGGNEATKKTKKNLLKHQYGNFKAEGSETLEQMFNRLQVIIGQLQSDLDTMSLDDLYNHLKVYESEVQKKLEPNSQNMAFISSAKHSSRNEESNTASVPTASTNVPTASASVATISQDTAAPKSQDRGRRDIYRQRSKAEEQAPKALMAIDGVRWDWSYMANDGEDHALVADEEAPTEFALMANTSNESKVFDSSLCSKDCKKYNDSLNKSIYEQGWIRIQCCSSSSCSNLLFSKKDLSWTGLLEFADDTVTNYSSPSPTMESTSGDDQNRNPSVSKTEASPSAITPKPFIKFVKASDSPT